MKVGQTTRWTSHGGKTTRTKEGIIIAIVPAGVRRAPIAKGLRDSYYGVKGLTDLMNEDCVRDHESYIVYATDEKGNHRIYHPLTRNLEVLLPVIHHTSTGTEWISTDTSSKPVKPGLLARLSKFLFG